MYFLVFFLNNIFQFRFYSEKEVYTQERRQIYFLLVLTCVYIIPFLLTISFYICILNTLFRQFFKVSIDRSQRYFKELFTFSVAKY